MKMIFKPCLVIYRILGECLLISSLPGSALRALVDIARLNHNHKSHINVMVLMRI